MKKFVLGFLIGAIIASVLWFKNRRPQAHQTVGGQTMHDITWVIDPSRTLSELRTEARARALPDHGNEAELLRRIIAAIAAHAAPTPAATAAPTPRPPTPTPTPPAPTPTPLAITTANPLRRGRERERYDFRVTATGGTHPYEWDATDLPRGLRIDRRGRITGTPREYGMFHPTITVDENTGGTASRSFDLEIRENPQRSIMPGFEADDVTTWFMRIFLIGLGIVALLVAIWGILTLIDNIDWPNLSDDNIGIPRDYDDGNRTGDTGNNDNDRTNGTIMVGGLEVTTSDDYENGVEFGQIRDQVPAGYIVVGDVSTPSYTHDSNSTTGQIMVLLKPTTIIGSNEGSIQKIRTTNWQQAVKIKATEMRLTGCMNGCAKIIVIDQDGNILDY